MTAEETHMIIRKKLEEAAEHLQAGEEEKFWECAREAQQLERRLRRLQRSQRIQEIISYEGRY